MSKRVLALSAALLMFSMLFAGCSKAPGGESSGSAGSTGSAGDTSSPSNTATIELPKFDIQGTKVQYLGWASGKEFTTEGTDLYRLNQMLKEHYGAEIQFVRTTYDELPTKLAQLVLSSNSPDLVHYKYQDNPGFILNELVTEITPDIHRRSFRKRPQYPGCAPQSSQ